MRQPRQDRRSLPVLRRINLEQTVRQVVGDQRFGCGLDTLGGCGSCIELPLGLPTLAAAVAVSGQHRRMARVLESFQLSFNVLQLDNEFVPARKSSVKLSDPISRRQKKLA